MAVNVSVRVIPGKGRGLFAEKEFAKEELIERCELILLELENVPADLESYVYEYRKGVAALALGNGSLLNHHSKPSCEFKIDYRKRQLVITAKRKIKEGEELTINYRYDKAMRKKYGIS